jgi:hypothetical protein
MSDFNLIEIATPTKCSMNCSYMCNYLSKYPTQNLM